MIFRQIAKYFGLGLVTVLPFAFVIWVVLFIFNQIDGLFGNYVDDIDGLYIPGMGFIIVMFGITLVGIMTRLYISRRILQWIDHLFARIPYIKSIYTMVKDLLQNLVSSKRRAFSRVVLVNWPDERAQVLGFVTNEELPPALNPDGNRIAVYLPNAFQFAGPTVIVERDKTIDCDFSVEEALQFVVSAGMGHSTKDISEFLMHVDEQPTTTQISHS